MNPFSDDQPEPTEQPLRARVPEHVAGGCFSTGVIVMSAQNEFLLDFVQNLGRPHQIVARVILPPSVLPQLVDALGRNIQLYRGRWGELPQPQLVTHPAQADRQSVQMGTSPLDGAPHNPSPTDTDSNSGAGGSGALSQSDSIDSRPDRSSSLPDARTSGSLGAAGEHSGSTAHSSGTGPGQFVRQPTAQEIYDDLKIRDDLLSGVYANAVMIGHGPHEFSFDFITNFYPHSAVSARVFLAAGQVPRLYESLKGTWEQVRMRSQFPPSPPPTPPPSNPPSDWT